MVNDATTLGMSSPTIEKSYASIVRRLGAYVIDALLLFVAFGLLLGSIFGLVLYLTVGFEWMRNGLLLWGYVFTIVSLPLWLYYSFFESSVRQATIGMRLLGLRVTGLKGERISFGRALLRTVVKLIPFEVNHAVMFLPVPIESDPNAGFRAGFILVGVLMCVYLASVFLTRHKQSIHDLAARTVVVRDG